LRTELEKYMVKTIFTKRLYPQVVTKGCQLKDVACALHSLIPKFYHRLHKPFPFSLSSRQIPHRYIKCHRVMILQSQLYLEFTPG